MEDIQGPGLLEPRVASMSLTVREAVQEHNQRRMVFDGDMLFNDDHQLPNATLGRKILASSFQGGKRWYNKRFQDMMAICRKYGKPDLFITMTCNPKWPEIKDALLPGQTPQDRPDIVARVFKQKADQMMDDLTKGGLLGKVIAFMWANEFQKRGLPHRHVVIKVDDAHRPQTAEIVDQVVCCELPPNPAEVEDPAMKKERQELEKIVINNMIHGPCGNENPNCPCMVNGKCSKGYPKEFMEHTVMDPNNFYATYRQRSPEHGGRVMRHPDNGRILDNSMVIPYNPHLSKRYDCHINVECCASVMAAKYLNKYITKGNDRAMVATSVEGEPRDEIAEYLDVRSVGSSEAIWHLFGFPISKSYPPVKALRVHLFEGQAVYFEGFPTLQALENQRETELTAFFRFNAEHAGQLRTDQLAKYVDMPAGHVYNENTKNWTVRKRGTAEPSIGRVHCVPPLAGDVFYLRMLLHDDHCKGKTSFDDMLTLDNGTVCETYKEVCRVIGLLQDDQEWERVLEESAATKMCPQIREMFVVIIMFCEPSNHWLCLTSSGPLGQMTLRDTIMKSS